MYKIKAKKFLAVALALVMAASTLAGFPAAVFACDGCGVSQNQTPPASTENNPHVTGGRVRNTETIPLNWDLEEGVSGGRVATTNDGNTYGAEPKPEFDPNRHWTQDEDGTIWQDGIPFANMDNIFVFDTLAQPQERPPDWQDKRITSSDPDLIANADRLITAYLQENNMTMEEALAISHAELPFLILNGEVVRTDKRGIAFTEISEESIHPLAQENPRMFNPVYEPDYTKVSVVRSNLANNIVVPIYHNEHPGGYIFAHEFSLINEIGETYLKIRRQISEDTPRLELDLQWIYDMDPRTRITMIENHPEVFRKFNTWEVMSSFAVWCFEEMEFLPMSVATENSIPPLSYPAAAFDQRDAVRGAISIPPGQARDTTWYVHFSGGGLTRSDIWDNWGVWFSEFTVVVGGIVIYGYCGNPWQATPQATNPDRDKYAQGLTGRWPWSGDVPIHNSGPDTHRGARIAAGAMGAHLSGVTAAPRNNLPQGTFDSYWVAAIPIVQAAAEDPHSNLSTIGLGEYEPNAAGGSITIEAERGVEVTIPITHAFGRPVPNDHGEVGGSLGAHFIANPDWFSSFSISTSSSSSPLDILNKRFALAYVNYFTFTIAENVEEDSITFYLTQSWTDDLAGGWRANNRTHQDIWFALPRFRWRITVQLPPRLNPVFDCTFVGARDDEILQVWKWNRPDWWTSSHDTVIEWNEYVENALEGRNLADLNGPEREEIAKVVSLQLWERWADRGMMNMFFHPDYGALPGGPENGLDEVLPIVEYYCIRGPKPPVEVTLPFFNCTEADELSIIILWDDYEEQAPFECTLEEVPLWEAWARALGMSILQEQLAALDIDEDCFCVPTPDGMCDHHWCYEFNRGDNTDEQDEGQVGLQDYEEIQLRWNNIAFAFGETHMTTEGFNNNGFSVGAQNASTINLTRTTEVFQAMSGMPETEFLYINVGGHEGAFDVEYSWHRRVYQFAIWWVESDDCPLFCEASRVMVCYDCGGDCCPCGPLNGCCPIFMPKTYYTSNNTERSPIGTMHSDWERTWTHSDISAVDSTPGNPQNETITLNGRGVFRHNEDYARAEFRFLEIRWGQARRATHARVYNPHLYRINYEGSEIDLTQTPITLEDLSTNINGTPRLIRPGRQATEHYGTDGNLSMFAYKWFAGHWHTEGKPSPRCFNQTSESPVFRQRVADAHARGREELGNLFSLNANLIYLLGVNQYRFIRPGGHGSGGPTVQPPSNPPGENLVSGRINQWHNAPNPTPVELHSAPNVNYFNPLREQWHAYNITPVSGFQGRYHRADASRNGRVGHNPNHVIPGHNPEYPALAWHTPSTQIIPRLHNNIYNFMPFLAQNWLDYTYNIVTFPAGGTPRDLLSTTEWVGPDHLSNTTSAVDTVQHLTHPNHVRLEYTAWQVPSSPHNQPTGPHAGLDDPTAYYGPNPVIIHNPVSSIFAWVHDVPSFTLQDQRIRTVAHQRDGKIMPHERRIDYAAAARLYVDFDYRITIPNDGTFNTYWHFEPRQTGHPVGRDRWGTVRNSPLLSTNYIGRGSPGLSLDGQRPGNQTGAASGMVNFDPTPLVHNTGFSQLGLRGPGWIGDMQPWVPIRNHANPYQQLGTRQGPTAGWNPSPSIWDVSKWIDAKYIQFPFDVYFYGNFVPPFTPPHPGSQGTSSIEIPFTQSPSFFPAGTWITLYDNSRQEQAGPGYDPTEFSFRIPSHVADLQNQEIRIVARSINSPSTNPNDLWYGGSEWNINAMRLPQGTGTRDTRSTSPTGSGQDQEAFHSTATVLTVDVIGRIGNVLVDDNTDPQWTDVFWATDENNRPLINSPVHRAIGQHYNMYESVQNEEGLNGRPWHPRNSAVGGIFNRFSQLSQWHGMDATLLYPENPQHGANTLRYALPLERNPQPQYSHQVTGLGYEFQYSVQTLGRYGDGEMWVHPRYILMGDWATHPGDGHQGHFQMFATNPFDPTGVRQMFYDSAIPFPNWQFGSHGNTRGTGNMTDPYTDLSVGWQPHYHYQIWHSLADPRAKINTRERDSFSFIEAVRLGQNYRWHLGDPSFIRISTELRTHQGSPGTKGRIGEGIHYGYIESSPGGESAEHNGRTRIEGGTWGGPIASFDTTITTDNYRGSAWENAHRWHARHHLPNSTEVIFHDNLPNNMFEGRTDNQYIGLNFTFRTHANNGLWDLSTYTGATNVQPYGNAENAPHDRPIHPPGDNNPPNRVPGREGRNRGRNFWLRPLITEPSPQPDRGEYDWVYPFTPIIVFDYSRPAQSDRITIGTH